MSNPLIVDGRNLLEPDEVRRAGFAYEGIGRRPGPQVDVPDVALARSPQAAPAEA
jgi:hypothetical protein